MITLIGSSPHGNFWPSADGKRLMVSIEPEHRLVEYKRVSTAINNLYMEGHKDLARAIHKANKELVK